MKQIKSIELKNFKLVLEEKMGWYFIYMNDVKVHTSKHLANSLFRFDMEYNSYCVNNQ